MYETKVTGKNNQNKRKRSSERKGPKVEFFIKLTAYLCFELCDFCCRLDINVSLCINVDFDFHYIF